jgi:poly-beta-1,6-N-acetyl-D-glucosamine synthase
MSATPGTHAQVGSQDEAVMTESNGAGEAAEPVRADGAAVADWEADAGPIPRVSWEPEETRWDTEALQLPDQDSDHADGHPEANGHREEDGETAADQQSPADPRPEEILPPLNSLPAIRPRIVALVPAHNEEEGIAATIGSLLAQTRQIDRIVIVSDNSTDRTVEIARSFPVTVIETTANMHAEGSALDLAGCCREKNSHRKSGALNRAWNMYAQDADIIVCADGDTVLPPHAVADWEKEFAADPNLAGSSSQPVMTGKGYLPRLQRYEFTRSATQSLSRGWCRVVSGTGCAFRNLALREVASHPEQEGPWTYQSVVEDYHLTYQLRRSGWHCAMSPTVFCYTGSMKTLKALWHQRIKWQGGTAGDLLRFGCNRLNYREWVQQGYLLFNLGFWVIWIALNASEIVINGWSDSWYWIALLGLLVVVELIHVRRMVGHAWSYDWKDILLAVCLVHVYVYNVLSLAWGLASWWKALSGQMGDLWAPQYRAEGQDAEEMKIGVGS